MHMLILMDAQGSVWELRAHLLLDPLAKCLHCVRTACALRA